MFSKNSALIDKLFERPVMTDINSRFSISLQHAALCHLIDSFLFFWVKSLGF